MVMYSMTISISLTHIHMHDINSLLTCSMLATKTHAHHMNSLYYSSFASAFNNFIPNSSAKSSKKRRKTFHLVVMEIQHHSRWLKHQRQHWQQQVLMKLRSTPPATQWTRTHSKCSGDTQPVLLQVKAESRETWGDDWPLGETFLKTPLLQDGQPHQLLTRDGKVTQRHVFRQERQRKEAQPKPGELFFFPQCRPVGHKQTSPSCPA